VTHPDWSDVVERLGRLAVQPNAGNVFGSMGHGWRLEPALSAAELAELEGQLLVELPSEYRSFLLEVSRGGAGPAYGLFPLRRVDGQWQWEGDGASLTDLNTLSQPFPYVEAFNPADGLPDPPDEDDYDSEAAYHEAEDAYWELHDTVVYRPEYSVGLLYLCHFGCALRAGLVVSGPARGQMWADETADGSGFQPVHGDDGTPLGFARWYRQWLDESSNQMSENPSAPPP